MSSVTAVGAAPARPVASPRFETVYVGLTCLIILGSFVDIWAHRNLDSALETFMTPWHGLLYGAYIATALALGWAAIPYRGHIGEWRRTIPVGYGWAVAGAIGFALAGLADLVWHTIFGIEAGTEALLSPTHLGLACALTLMISAPYRAWTMRSEAPVGVPATSAPWTVYVSVILATVVIMGITQYLNAFADFWPTYEPQYLATGVAATVLQSAIFTAALCLMIRNLGPMRIGAVALLLVVPAVLLGAVANTWLSIPVALVAAIVAEAIVIRTRDHLAKPMVLRWVAFAILLVLWAVYMGALAATWSLTWSVHLWTGTILIGGLTGWLVAWFGEASTPTRA